MTDAKLSASQFARICRLDRRTVSARLANVPHVAGRKGAHLYAFTDALPALCRRDTPDQETSRQRLTRAQADIAEMELREKQQELVPLEIAIRIWDNMLRNIRSRVIASHLNHDEQADLFRELRSISRAELLEGIE